MRRHHDIHEGMAVFTSIMCNQNSVFTEVRRRPRGNPCKHGWTKAGTCMATLAAEPNPPAFKFTFSDIHLVLLATTSLPARMAIL